MEESREEIDSQYDQGGSGSEPNENHYMHRNNYRGNDLLNSLRMENYENSESSSDNNNYHWNN